MSRQRRQNQKRHQNSYQYATVGTPVVIPEGFVKAAATVASIAALETYWQAERLLAQPDCGGMLPLHVHQRVIAANHEAKRWAKVAARFQHGPR